MHRKDDIMNYSAIFHRPMSEYAHAVDDTHYIFRLKTAANDIKECTFYYGDRAGMSPKITFYPVPMKKVRSDKYYDYFEVLLETEILRVAYYFELNDGIEKAYYLGDCFSKTDDVERYEHFQFPFNLKSDRIDTPKWVKDAVVYNIFPDSFANGKRTMNPTESVLDYKGEECRSRLGGTIKGIEENLDYISELGCNCIYLNPFFVANSYHKYDLVDYFHVDPTRGTDEDFRSMVNRAHSMGIKVIIDGVFNHVSWRHEFFQDVLKNGKKSPYFDYFYDIPDEPVFPEHGKLPDYVCFAYVADMPKTNTANQGLKDYFCEVGAYWIREFDVDGWRLDVANELDDQFLRAFRNSVKNEKADALVIGEVWENANHYVNGNMMDGAMNYDIRRFCGQFFAYKTIDASEFDARVSNLLMRYPKQAEFAQLNLLDSHDVSRFLTECDDDKEKMELAVLFQMTFVGMPSVFYGDEKGLTGKEEVEYRRPMEFDRNDSLEDVYKKFIKLRLDHGCIKNGEFDTLIAENGIYGYRRFNDDEAISVYINNGDDEFTVNDNGDVLLAKNYSDGKLTANGYVVIKENKKD